MNWKAPVRNYNGIQFGELRQKVEGKFHAFHDALSVHYYSQRDLPDPQKTDFIYDDENYGKLNKDKFDKLHGLIFEMSHLALCAENGNAEENKKFDLDELDHHINDEKTVRRSDVAREYIKLLKKEGIEITLK